MNRFVRTLRYGVYVDGVGGWYPLYECVDPCPTEDPILERLLVDPERELYPDPIPELWTLLGELP